MQVLVSGCRQGLGVRCMLDWRWVGGGLGVGWGWVGRRYTGMSWHVCAAMLVTIMYSVKVCVKDLHLCACCGHQGRLLTYMQHNK